MFPLGVKLWALSYQILFAQHLQVSHLLLGPIVTAEDSGEDGWWLWGRGPSGRSGGLAFDRGALHPHRDTC